MEIMPRLPLMGDPFGRAAVRAVPQRISDFRAASGG